MIYMGCDYQEGAFPQILARYGETNLVQQLTVRTSGRSARGI